MRNTLPRLTLIVAVTPSYGIGKAGTLPWPRMASEMAYFSRVTKRVPSSFFSSAPSTSSTSSAAVQNAVIMGRKTWESIPPKFRPLPGRINVVISRSAGKGLDLGSDKAHAVTSLQAALELLARKPSTVSEGEDVGRVGRVFVIGGAQIYAEAMQRSEAENVLLTRVKKDYECDTFFPVRFGEKGGGGEDWELQSDEVRDRFIGETAPGDDDWSVELWSRKET